MLSRKSTVIFAALVVLAFTLAGCSRQSTSGSASVGGGTGSTTAQAPKESKGTIWMITSHRAHPVWLVGKAGFEKSCQEQGYTPKWEAADNGEEDVNINYLEQAIVEKPAGIIVFPGNENSFTPVIDKAVDAGIPVVTIHADAPKSKRKAFIGPNKKTYAEACADELARVLGEKGKVGVMQGTSYPHENQVYDYFAARMKAKHPGIQIVAHDYDTTEQVKATQKAIDMIQANPGLQAVFSTTGGGCLSWSKAMEETGTLGKIKVISMDVTKQNLDLVKEGKIYAVIGQGIYDEGYKGVQLVLDPKAPEINYTDTPIITKDRVDEFYAQTGGK